MIRTLNLDAWARNGLPLVRMALCKRRPRELDALIAEVDRLDLDAEIMRAPVPGEPLVFGLG